MQEAFCFEFSRVLDALGHALQGRRLRAFGARLKEDFGTRLEMVRVRRTRGWNPLVPGIHWSSSDRSSRLVPPARTVQWPRRRSNRVNARGRRLKRRKRGVDVLTSWGPEASLDVSQLVMPLDRIVQAYQTFVSAILRITWMHPFGPCRRSRSTLN